MKRPFRKTENTVSFCDRNKDFLGGGARYMLSLPSERKSTPRTFLLLVLYSVSEAMWVGQKETWFYIRFYLHISICLSIYVYMCLHTYMFLSGSATKFVIFQTMHFTSLNYTKGFSLEWSQKSFTFLILY